MAAVFGAALAQTVEFCDSLAFHSHVRQGVQVPVIGLLPDLIIAPEVGHALAHRYPAPGVVGAVQHLELFALLIVVSMRSTLSLSVHFDSITLHAMFDAPAFGAFLEIGADLALEVAVQLAAQEAQDILGGKAQQGRLQQSGWTRRRLARSLNGTSVAISAWKIVQ